MISLLLFLLLVLGFGAGAAWFLRGDQGYVLLSFHGWVLETTAVGMVLLVLAVCLVLVFGTRLLFGTWRLPTTLREALGRRRERRAREAFVAGLGHLAGEDWERAEIELVRRAADHEAAPLNYLFAARAAHRAGHRDRAEHYLSLAAATGDGDDPRITLTRAELLRADGRCEEAIALLQAAREQHPKHGPLAALLAECLAEAGRWQSLQTLLQAIERRKVLPAERWRGLMREAAIGQLNEARASGRVELLREAWDRIPRPVREGSEVRRLYLQSLAALNAERQALELIARAVNEAWDAELASLYGRIEAGDSIAQLATVEQWLKKYGETPELLLVAGRVCRRNRLWGKARSYLDAAIRLAPTPEAYLELARLCQDTHQAEDACRYYRQGLELATER